MGTHDNRNQEAQLIQIDGPGPAQVGSSTEANNVYLRMAVNFRRALGGRAPEREVSPELWDGLMARQYGFTGGYEVWGPEDFERMLNLNPANATRPYPFFNLYDGLRSIVRVASGIEEGANRTAQLRAQDAIIYLSQGTRFEGRPAEYLAYLQGIINTESMERLYHERLRVVRPEASMGTVAPAAGGISFEQDATQAGQGLQNVLLEGDEFRGLQDPLAVARMIAAEARNQVLAA